MRGGFYPHKSPDVSITVGICPLAGFLVLQGAYSKILALASILSWGFSLDILFPMFLEEAQKLSLNLIIISVRDGLPDPPLLLSVSNIVAGFLFYSALVWKSSCGLLFPFILSLCKSVSEVLLYTASQIQVMFQGFFSITSFFVVMCQRRPQLDVFPSLWQDFFVAVFTFYCRRGEN